MTLVLNGLFYFRTGGACEAGWPITDREGIDSAGWTMVSPDQQFLCDGQLTEWRYQGKRSNVSFRAIVWRPVDSSANGTNVSQFKIVGINDIPAGAINRPINYAVPESERITVKAGDVIGWSFEESVLAYNRGGGNRVHWVGRNLNHTLQVKQVFDMNAGVEEREYSIAATVGG